MNDNDTAPHDMTSITRSISFHDPRPPQEIRMDLERDLMVLLNAMVEDSRLVMPGTVKVDGATCAVVLRFEAAGVRTNWYSLVFEMAWGELPSDSHAYHRHAADGWFDLWARNFTDTGKTFPEKNCTKRYADQTAAVLGAEAHLNSVEAVQQEIINGMRAGASFSTAHKEGGTVLSFRGDRFIRADFGESQERVEFADEPSFLTALRNLYQWETGRGFHPDQPSEYVRWKLMLRLLRKAAQVDRHGAGKTLEGHQRWIIVLVAIVVGGGFALLRNRRFRMDPPPIPQKFNGIPPKFIPPPQPPEWRNPVLGR